MIKPCVVLATKHKVLKILWKKNRFWEKIVYKVYFSELQLFWFYAGTEK